ncbi:MAG: metallophosphoesterase family protein [Bacteroidales bacterium]
MENIYFTSDHHFGHKNIIKYSNRPFADVEEMNNSLIERWNSKIQKNDKVYHLGDIGFCDTSTLKHIISQLNGKIHLVKGNHDRISSEIKNLFEWVKDYHELKLNDVDHNSGKQLIVLSHYAMRVWNKSHHGSYHLYGHSHGELPDDIHSLSFDVGVDAHNYYPLSYQEVKEIMNKKEWVSPFE